MKALIQMSYAYWLGYVFHQCSFGIYDDWQERLLLLVFVNFFSWMELDLAEMGRLPLPLSKLFYGYTCCHHCYPTCQCSIQLQNDCPLDHPNPFGNQSKVVSPFSTTPKSCYTPSFCFQSASPIIHVLIVFQFQNAPEHTPKTILI